jgi:hypothetical protein
LKADSYKLIRLAIADGFCVYRVPLQKLFDPSGEDPDKQVGLLHATADVQVRVESLTLHVENLPFTLYSGPYKTWRVMEGEEG